MITSIQALQDENLRLKTQVHMYEQYQVLLRIQRNLAVSLGKSVSVTQAFNMILDTISQIQGVWGSGILIKENNTGKYDLCAYSGVFEKVKNVFKSVDSSNMDNEFLFAKGVHYCKEIKAFYEVCKRIDGSIKIGTYPVMSDNEIHAVVLVIYDSGFDQLSLAIDLLEAISDQVGDVLRRVEQEETNRNSLEEKKILLKEVHHRVKNNLAMIISFISLQETGVQDRGALNILHNLQQKIASIVGIYELLYKTGDLKAIQFDAYAVNLVDGIITTLTGERGIVLLDHKCDSISIDIDTAITLGLILAELATNSLKYAFPSGEGVIGLRLYKTDDEMRIIFWDNGQAFPEGFSMGDSEGIGERLIIELTEQLKGSVDFNADESKFSFRFPAWKQ